VYGLVYDLGGAVASPVQFYLTDSTNHFLRGSLYFEAKPNPDSIAPVLAYVKKDIELFTRSLEWK
jgi:gliding motility-associated lipoprotein GldD